MRGKASNKIPVWLLEKPKEPKFVYVITPTRGTKVVYKTVKQRQ